MKVKLVVGQGPHKGKEIPVSTQAKYVIGRGEGCHLRPASQAISKRHCSIEVRDGKCYLEDLNSTNGTFINDEQLKGEREIRDGDMVKIGPLDFVVRLIVAAPVAAAAPTPAPALAAAVPSAPAAAAPAAPPPAKPKPAPPPQVEVPTHVEKEAKKPTTPARSAPPTPSNLDDDTIGSMLLDLDEGAKPEPGLTEPAVPEGSTIMDLLIPQKDTGAPSAPYRPKDVKKDATPASTSKAAQDILEKYRRRPRS
jgi:predicted component of type VI protein secretion system